MRILITNNHLVRMGGTETWVLTMVQELARDHEVFVFAHHKGAVSDLIGRHVTDNPPFCDLALVNHRNCMHVDAQVKVFTSHGAFHELEQPVEGADFYVAVSEEIASKYGIRRIIRNPIDTDALVPLTPVSEQPKRALAIVSPSALRVVREACSSLGIEVLVPNRDSFSIPELANQVDLVFSLGRGALEAMSCGRPVIIYDERDYTRGSDGYFNDARVRECNYSGRYFNRQVGAEELIHEIRKYRREDGHANREYVLEHHSVSTIARSYLRLYDHHAALRTPTKKGVRISAGAAHDSAAQPNHLVSVVINACRSSELACETIESVLNQQYPEVEAILAVSERNKEILSELSRYSSRVRHVMVQDDDDRDALSAGFAESRGDILLFLDAGDRLISTAIYMAIETLAEHGFIKVHWPVRFGDPGTGTAPTILPRHMPAGDLSGRAQREGPSLFPPPLLSGSVWRRSALERILPLPKSGNGIGAGLLLSELAQFLGPVAKIIEPQTDRSATADVHASAGSIEVETDARLHEQERLFDGVAEALRAAGMAVDPDEWRCKSWSYRVLLAMRDIFRHIPEGSAFLLIDEEQIASDDDHVRRDFGGRKPVPFIARAGQYWGPPSDDAQAISEVERNSASGVRYLVLVWPAFWWLDHYRGFAQYLRTSHRCLLENPHIVIFELLRGGASPSSGPLSVASVARAEGIDA